ncbi:hypothetical protein TNCV_2927211 [Trichonephila clavipes]|nr:hypothetical protein TNCV_2927211 [Trichonephila clavipes]
MQESSRRRNSFETETCELVEEKQKLLDMRAEKKRSSEGERESHIKIMYDPSSFANPTPLAHADTSRDVLPRGEIEKDNNDDHRDEITDFVQLIPVFQECNEV